MRFYGEKVIPLNHESRVKNIITPIAVAIGSVNLAIKTIVDMVLSTCFNWETNYATTKKPSCKGKKLPNGLRAAVTLLIFLCSFLGCLHVYPFVMEEARFFHLSILIKFLRFTGTY